MSIDNNYQEAKRKLSDLRAEMSALSSALHAAATANDTAEIDRLRERQSTLPGEIVEAEFRLASAKVASLRAEQAEAQKELERAKVLSKETDARVEAELKELEAKRKALSDERYACLRDVYRLKDSILNRAKEIQAAEQELKKWLEQVTPAIV